MKLCDILSIVIAFIAIEAVGQSLPSITTVNPAALRDKEFQDISIQVKTNAATVNDVELIARIQALMHDDSQRTIYNLKESWLKSLSNAKRYDVVADLCLMGTIAAGSETGSVESFQIMRTRALLSAGKTDEALAQAKALYNVASMR